MSTQSKTIFMNEARVRLPGITDEALNQQLKFTLFDFCNETNAWWSDVDIDLEADTLEYDILPDDGAVVRVLSIVDENDNPREADIRYPDNGPVQLVLRAALASEETWTVRVAVVPESYDSLRAPDWLYDKYKLVLLDGIVARCMMQPAKPWTNERLGIFHERSYRSGVSRARVERARSYRAAVQAWRFPTSYATRRR